MELLGQKKHATITHGAVETLAKGHFIKLHDPVLILLYWNLDL